MQPPISKLLLSGGIAGLSLVMICLIHKSLKSNWVNPMALDPFRPGVWELVGGKRVLHVPPDECSIEHYNGHVEFRKARNASEIRQKALAVQVEKNAVTDGILEGRHLDGNTLKESEESRRSFDKVREQLVNGEFFNAEREN